MFLIICVWFVLSWIPMWINLWYWFPYIKHITQYFDQHSLWNQYRVNFAIKIGNPYNLPSNKVIHIYQFCYGHFLLCKFPSHTSNLLQLFPLWISKSPLGSEYIILISIYDTHFGSNGSDYIIWTLHSHNTWYWYHLKPFFNMDSIVTLIM